MPHYKSSKLSTNNVWTLDLSMHAGPIQAPDIFKIYKFVTHITSMWKLAGAHENIYLRFEVILANLCYRLVVLPNSDRLLSYCLQYTMTNWAFFVTSCDIYGENVKGSTKTRGKICL